MLTSLLSLFTLASCNAQVPALGGPVAPESRYVLDYRATKAFGDFQLEQRVSLIAPIGWIYFSKFTGINDLNVFALYNAQQEFTIPDAVGKFYIQKGNFLRFTIGDALDETNRADIISEEAGRPVGKVQFAKENFPNRPGWILELCSGSYEEECTLSYSSETKTFSVKMND